MRLLRLLFFAAFASLFFVAPIFAAEESISSYIVDITLRQDGSFKVEENIDYDFADNERHGIYRDIPVRYSAFPFVRSIGIKDISVADEKGAPQPYVIEKAEKRGSMRIKIGDPDTTTSGAHHYSISYTVERALLFETNTDALYWNAIGGDWKAGIGFAQVRLHVPESLDIQKLNFDCHSGYEGEKGSCTYKKESNSIIASVAMEGDPPRLDPENLYTNIVLQPGMGFSISASWPKGTITRPTFVQKAIFFLKDNWPFGIPLAVAGVLFFLWHTKGRDPKGRGTIIHEYMPPKGLSPSQVGAIFDESVHNRDVSADLIQLAIDGYIKFRKEGHDYIIEKRKDFAGIPHEFQRTMITDLFSVAAEQKNKKAGELQEINLNSIKRHFNTKFEAVKEKIYGSMIEGGYFAKNPEAVRRSYYFVGVMLMVGAFWIFSLYTLFAVMIIISGILFLIFGAIMPAKTLKGVHLREYVLGLKTYIEVAEKDRIQFHNAPAKSPEYFEQLLPYAMVLGVEKEWARQFEGIYTQSPDWYSGYGRGFVLNSFVHDLGSFSNTVDHSLSAAPQSSSGGGFSGGGFGGGGGGSW